MVILIHITTLLGVVTGLRRAVDGVAVYVWIQHNQFLSIRRALSSMSSPTESISVCSPVSAPMPTPVSHPPLLFFTSASSQSNGCTGGFARFGTGPLAVPIFLGELSDCKCWYKTSDGCKHHATSNRQCTGYLNIIDDEEQCGCWHYPDERWLACSHTVAAHVVGILTAMTVITVVALFSSFRCHKTHFRPPNRAFSASAILFLPPRAVCTCQTLVGS